MSTSWNVNSLFIQAHRKMAEGATIRLLRAPRWTRFLFRHRCFSICTSNLRWITASCCNSILTVCCEHISLTQNRTSNERGRADFILHWPDWASAPAHPAHHGLSAEEPLDPKAPVWADSDSQSGWRKKFPGGENVYTQTLPCRQEYGWLKFHLKIISRALAGMYELVHILCIEWKQTLAKVL